MFFYLVVIAAVVRNPPEDFNFKPQKLMTKHMFQHYTDKFIKKGWMTGRKDLPLEKFI